MQLEADDVAQGNVTDARGDEVVEGLVQPGDVGDDPNERPRGGQTPTAFMKSSSRLSSSQANPVRPKWP